MKKMIALAALIAAMPASAFWGWNDWGNSGYGNGYNNGYVDGAGDAEADFTFDFNMSARFRGEGRGHGYGVGDGYGNGYGYNAHIPYYGAPYGYLPPWPPVAPEAPAE
ncbi:MAG: sulfur globule family protein [Gammaproteobacteria bacterium]|nr:sulfur globule family protein [Gammaproteobacteria bacterium]